MSSKWPILSSAGNACQTNYLLMRGNPLIRVFFLANEPINFVGLSRRAEKSAQKKASLQNVFTLSDIIHTHTHTHTHTLTHTLLASCLNMDYAHMLLSLWEFLI